MLIKSVPDWCYFEHKDFFIWRFCFTQYNNYHFIMNKTIMGTRKNESGTSFNNLIHE